ncbi:Hypothetical_protein [Hexamita inflata]|uniref:Hypothetical_protein n=1 Tax=Hexamita inflata TaxID=28002 RepID=A0AA86QVF2_9EUKA|nr:Hypothetical protein HINF_LOCUS54426 [Hexamita inflata]
MSSFNNSQSPMFSFISEQPVSPPRRPTLKSFRQSHSLDLGTLRQSQIFTEFYRSPKAHLQNLENTSQIQFPDSKKAVHSFEKPHKLKVKSIDFNDDFKADLNFFSDSDDFAFNNQSQETLLNVKLARNQNELRTFLQKVEKMEGIFQMCEQKTDSLQRKAKRLRRKIVLREEEEKRKKEEEM